MQAHKYLSEGKTAHKEANISGWIIVPTPTQLSTQHSPSRTSNTSNQSIRTPSTCAANFSEKKIVCYTVNPTDRQAQKYLCGQHAQNFEHFIPTDRHTSTCASNICRNSNTSTQPIGRHKSTCVANMRRTSNTSSQPIGTQVPVHPTSA